MAQDNLAAHNEGNGQWLPLIEYSIKSGVSLSTIRRKIKSNSLPFKLEKGKYLIFLAEDGAVIEPTPVPAPRLNLSEPPKPSPKPAQPTPNFQKKLDRMVSDADESDKAIKMLSDAYELALHEKDERIRLLERRVRESEERLSELKLLVQVLEEKYEVRY